VHAGCVRQRRWRWRAPCCANGGHYSIGAPARVIVRRAAFGSLIVSSRRSCRLPQAEQERFALFGARHRRVELDTRGHAPEVPANRINASANERRHMLFGAQEHTQNVGATNLTQTVRLALPDKQLFLGGCET
jgi:hypothetical protein